MAALIRSARLPTLSLTAFKHRGLTLTAIRFTHHLCVRNKSESDFIRRRTLPVTIQHVAQIQNVELTDNTCMNPIEDLQLLTQTRGCVTIKELNNVLTRLHKQESIPALDDAILLIRCAGKFLEGGNDTKQLMKRSLTKEIWDLIQEKADLDIQLYNALLSTYLENREKFSSEYILSQIKEKNLKPSKDTYRLLIRYHCLESDLNQAKKLMQEYLKEGHPQEIGLYNSLLFGYAHCKDLQPIDVILKALSSASIQPDAETYSILLSVYARLGELDKFNETFLRAKTMDTDGFQVDQIWRIIKPLLQSGDKMRSREVIRSLKKMNTIHDKYDFNIISVENKKLCAKDHPDIWNELKTSFRSTHKTGSLTDQAEENETEIKQLSRNDYLTLGGELIDAFKAGDFEVVEKHKNTLEENGNIKQLSILSALICMYCEQEDEDNAKTYWDQFFNVLSIKFKNQATEQPTMTQSLTKTIFLPICQHIHLLIKKKKYNEALECIKEGSLCMKFKHHRGKMPVEFNAVLYDCVQTFGIADTAYLSTRLKSWLNNSNIQKDFVGYLAEKNFDVVLLYVKYVSSIKNYYIGLHNVFIQAMKQNKITAMNELISSFLNDPSCKASIVLQDLFYAYIFMDEMEKARLLIQVEGFEIEAQSFNGHLYAVYKNDRDEEILEKILRLAEHKLPKVTLGKILNYLAHLYAMKNRFDDANAMLKRLDDENLLMEPIVIDLTIEIFEKNQQEPPSLKSQNWGERDPVAILVNRIRTAGVKHTEKEIKQTSLDNPQRMLQVVLQLTNDDNFKEMRTLLAHISDCGVPSLMISVYNEVKDQLHPLQLKRLKEVIPYSYLHGKDLSRFISMLAENKDNYSIITPEFLQTIYTQERTRPWIRLFSALGDKDNCQKRYEINNALWASFCGINFHEAKKYLKKIPKEYSLKYLFFALETACEHQKEFLSEFWPMIKDYIPPESIAAALVKKHVIHHYYEEDQIDEMLAEFDMCLELGIPMYTITLKSIVSMCHKHNRPVPKNVESFVSPLQDPS